MSQKDQMRKIVNYIKSSCMIFCAKVTRYSKMFLKYIKSSSVILYGKMFQYFQIVYYWCTLLCKNWFYFFFSSSEMQKFQYLLGCQTIGITSSNIFLGALRFLNLLCKAKSLAMFFCTYPRYLSTEFFNKLIASNCF